MVFPSKHRIVKPFADVTSPRTRFKINITVIIQQDCGYSDVVMLWAPVQPSCPAPVTPLCGVTRTKAFSVLV